MTARIPAFHYSKPDSASADIDAPKETTDPTDTPVQTEILILEKTLEQIENPKPPETPNSTGAPESTETPAPTETSEPTDDLSGCQEQIAPDAPKV